MTLIDDFLPSFSSVSEVTSGNAMIDRFVLDIGDYKITGENDQICYALNSLDHFEIPTARDSQVQLFSSANNTNVRAKATVKFSRGGSGNSEYSSRPLISGEIKKAKPRSRFPALRGGTVTLCIGASLNLTRFVQAQRFRGVYRPRITYPPFLAIERNPRWFRNETPLLPSDNLLIGNARAFGYVLQNSVSQIMTLYLDEIDETVVGLLRRRMDEEEIGFEERSYRSLQLLEVYWEFSSADSTALVEELSIPLQRLSERIKIRNREFRRPDEEITFNSKSINIQLQNDLWLRVYAKTNRRVRFEVEFGRRAIRNVFRRQTTASNQEIGEMALQLVEHAAQKVNWVLAEIRRETPIVEEAITVVGLISKIYTVLGDQADCQMVVSSLHTFGRFAPERNSKALDVARKLKVAGVLRTLDRRSIYVPTDQYEAAARTLMKLPSGI
ncbi:MAG: hypothetical protein JXQ85_16390 [Cognatishimia sp.]|uniref:hypothetical protein n=1 Tax=Cognatishimia sp. TaxID=2211648 RepID=UPI003B8C6AE7